MEVIEVLRRARHIKLTGKATKGFDWNAMLPAPFSADGWILFRLPHPDVFRATDRTVSRDTAETIHRFITNFCILSVGTDITPYTDTLSRFLREDSVEEAEYFPRLSVPLIVTGLSNYASSLGIFLYLTDQDPVPLPISLMHIWALAEAARIHSTCICAAGSWADTADDATEILRLTQQENKLIHESEEPYKNIFLETYADAFPPTAQKGKR